VKRLIRRLLVVALLIAVPLEGYVALAMPLAGDAGAALAAGPQAAVADDGTADCHGPGPAKGVCKASVFCSLCAGYIIPAPVTILPPAAGGDYAAASDSRHPPFVPEQPQRPPLAVLS
jgi:hypothetical protein